VPPEKGARESAQTDVSASHEDTDDFARMFPNSPPNQPIDDDTWPVQDSERENDGDRKFRSDMQVLKKYPPLLLSPLFSYLAILVLKLPITLSDIYLYHLK
jgi:hypothetical protein